MRALEAVLLALTVVVALVTVIGRPLVARRSVGIAGVAFTVLVAIQLSREGYRWQMVPAYLLAGVCGGILALRTHPGPTLVGVRRSADRWAGRFVALPLLTLLATALPIVLPVFELPAPSGPLPVGVTNLRTVFAGRPEVMTDDPRDSRELMVRVWYPAAPAVGARRAPYLSAEEARGMARELGRLASVRLGARLVPSFSMDHLTLVETAAFPDAPFAAGEARYPVLVFSHGYLGYSAQNTPLMIELASHGYVVFAIAHTFDAIASEFPGARVSGLGEHVARWMRRLAERPTTRAWKRFLTTAQGDEARRAFIEESLGVAALDLENRRGPPFSLAEWRKDVAMFLGELERIDAGTPPTSLASHLDLRRVGLLGMSFGGATAAQVCQIDDRCRVAVNIDGMDSMAGRGLMDTEFEKPLLLIYSSVGQTADAPSPDNPRNFQGHCDFSYEPFGRRGARADIRRIRIRGASHLQLSDAGLFARCCGGEIDVARAEGIVAAYSLSFFEKHLRGGSGDLLEGPSAGHPEVDFQTFPDGARQAP